MPRNIVFVAPFPTEPTKRFLRAAGKLDDVRILGVVHTPPPADERGLFHDLVRVTDPRSPQDVIDGVEVLRRRHGVPYRIIGILEELMVPLAEARQHHHVTGTRVPTAVLFREKAMMKDALRAAGLPVARHRLVSSADEARAFAEEVGLPIVLKPPAGVGARQTFRVGTSEELLRATEGLGRGGNSPVLAEEMLVGREHSFETITIGGEPKVSSFAQYFPGPLEVLETPWIQWACILPREIDTPLYDRARELGRRAIKALGLEDGMTHMEWYERSNGEIAIGEIAQRPPGPQLCQMTGLVHDIDIYRAWTRAVIDGELDAPWERKYAAGTAFIRGVGRGRVAEISGLAETHEAIKDALIEAKLPSLGEPKSSSYEGDGYVVVRHQSTEKVKELIRTIIETIKIRYTD